MNRKIKLVLGLFFTGLGIIGAILPVMPSTCFFIMAAYYFGQSSEKLENWLLQHPRIGPTIVNWRCYRAIPMLGKVMAVLGMSVSGIIVLFSEVSIYFKFFASLILLGSAAYVLSRPTLKPTSQSVKLN